jgi:hypothetical protein
VQPLTSVIVAVYEPVVFTVMVFPAMLPGFHVIVPEVTFALKVTLPPSQNVVGLEEVITGAVGAGSTLTVTGCDTAEQPLASVNVTE